MTDEAQVAAEARGAKNWTLEDWSEFLEWPVPVLAAATAVRLEREALWIHRRTEKFEFLDGRRVRKSIDIELTVPSGFGAPATPEFPVLPLAQPVKRFMRDFSLRDENGRLLTSLTRGENAAVSAMLLRLQATETLGGHAIPREVVGDFCDIAGLRWHHEDYPDDIVRGRRCTKALDRFRDAYVAGNGTESEAEAAGEAATEEELARHAESVRARLWTDGVMRSWLVHLAERFVLLVPDIGAEGSRRRVIVEYERELAPLPDEDAPVRRKSVPARLGGALSKLLRGASIDHRVNIYTRGPFSARSYHAELLAPEDLTIVGARLRLLTREIDDRGRRDRWEQIAADRSTPLVHLYANGRRLPREIDLDAPAKEVMQACAVRVRLRVRAGLVLPVFLTAAVLAGALTGGLVFRAFGHRPESSTAAAILIALPALYAAYLLPQGHPLMRRLFREFRAMLVVLALLPYAAAATLALDLSTTGRYISWSVFDLVAIGCLVASTRALIKALRVTFESP